MRNTARLLACLSILATAPTVAQTVDAVYFSDLRWRSIGPPRSGYISAPAGVPDYREYTLNWHATPGHTYRSTIVGIMVPPATYTAKLTVAGRSETQPITIVPDPRVHASAAALAAQFHLQQRMVAGLTASYEAFNYIQALRESGVARNIDADLVRLATNEFGIVHRDLGRRYSDQFIADAAPDASIVEGVDGPCKQLDAALERLRTLTRSVSASTSGRALPSWTPPPAPACGR